MIHTTEVLVMYEFNVSKSCIHDDKHVNNIKVGCLGHYRDFPCRHY